MKAPMGATVEISTTPSPFAGYAKNVTVKSLIIEKYAVPAQQGAVDGEGWKIYSNEIRYNHGAGIHMNSYQVIDGNVIHRNGQQGVSGGGDQIRLRNNEIAFNNTAGFDYNWEAGGVWFSKSTNLVIEGNYIHDNKGIGIHLDYNTYNWLIQANRTKGNYLSGIDNEVGYDGTARYNVSEADGTVPGKTNPSMWWGCGIYIYASRNTTVHNNTVLNSTNGICAISIARNVGLGNRGEFEVRNLSVHDNVIVQTNGGTATGAVASDGYYEGVYSSSWNNKWASNIYKLASTTAKSFMWQGGTNYATMDWISWRGYGHDVSGTVVSPTDTTFPTTRFTANQKVETVTSAQLWSLPTTTSTLLTTEAFGATGTLTKVAGPIRTGGVWWWNVRFADGKTGWCLESNLKPAL
jgi:parallel beta-helix repeat protein